MASSETDPSLEPQTTDDLLNCINQTVDEAIARNGWAELQASDLSEAELEQACQMDGLEHDAQTWLFTRFLAMATNFSSANFTERLCEVSDLVMSITNLLEEMRREVAQFADVGNEFEELVQVFGNLALDTQHKMGIKMGSCPCTQKVVPAEEPKPLPIPTVERRQVEVVLVTTTNNSENNYQCLKELQTACAPNHVHMDTSFENALNHIEQLDRTTIVILVSMGYKQKKLDFYRPQIDKVCNLRNLFVCTSENENKERPTEAVIQHVSGMRHLHVALRDTLRAVHSSPVHEYSSHDVSIAIRQDTINEFLGAIISIVFETTVAKLPLKFKLSQMKVILSSSNFQFIAQVELINAPKVLSKFTTKQVYGKAILKLEKGRLVLAVSQFIIELPKTLGTPDCAKYISSFPLDGYINFGHPLNLPEMFETKHLRVQIKNPRMVVEEKLVKLFVETSYMPT
ncbi:unnamed protein product [Adineta steineri]|uniref:Uncharacterized protein n=1 Tax=Adineta steineri TaxID=433720 RepID=A0A814VUB6_9BILA|nr:unnamed protein product [Adineta steineri]